DARQPPVRAGELATAERLPPIEPSHPRRQHLSFHARAQGGCTRKARLQVSDEIECAAYRARQRRPDVQPLRNDAENADALILQPLEAGMLALPQAIDADADLVAAIRQQRHRRIEVADVLCRPDDEEELQRPARALALRAALRTAPVLRGS